MDLWSCFLMLPVYLSAFVTVGWQLFCEHLTVTVIDIKVNITVLWSIVRLSLFLEELCHCRQS